MAPKKFEKISLFSQRQEKLNLFWPLFLLLVAVVLTIFSSVKREGPLYNWGMLLAATLFLNTIHTGFTLFMVFYLPEIQDWIREKAARELIHPYLKWSIAFCGLFAFAYFDIYFFGLKWNQTIFFVGAFLGLISQHHTIKQFFGVSLLYNRSHQLATEFSSVEQERFLKSEKRERFLFFGYMSTFMLGILALHLVTFYTGTAPTHARSIFGKLVWITMIFPVLLVLNSLFYPRAKESNKSLYLLRVFLGPAFFWAPTAAIANTSIHGVEYLFIFKKMVGNSKFKASKISSFVLASIILVLTLGCVAGPFTQGGRWLIESSVKNTMVLDLLAAFAMAVTFLHFYLDRILFRMSNADTRRLIFPLLLPAMPLVKSAPASRNETENSSSYRVS